MYPCILCGVCAVHLMCASMWREDNLKSSSSGTMHLIFEVEFFNGLKFINKGSLAGH